MIACYAWTDIQIINVVQVKLTYYSEEPVDLYVCMLERISKKLLSGIKKSGVFANIYEISPINYSFDKKIMNNIPFLAGTVFTILKKKHYEKVYERIVKCKNYSKILLAGFWGDSLFLVRKLLLNNKKLSIELVEEGSLSYCSFLERLCQAKPLGCEYGKKDIVSSQIIKLMILGKDALKVNGLVENIYLYEPLLAKFKPENKRKQIPKIDTNQNTTLIELLKDFTNDLRLDVIAAAKVVYFPQLSKLGDDVLSYEIYNLIKENFSINKFVVKLHPTACLKESVSRDILIDNQSYPFEVIGILGDCSNKILISRNTSCLLMMNYMFGYEPVIIYTYRLYNNNHEVKEPDLEWYIKSLKKVYKNPERILVPRTMEEMLEMIQYAKILLKVT